MDERQGKRGSSCGSPKEHFKFFKKVMFPTMMICYTLSFTTFVRGFRAFFGFGARI